MWHDRLFATVSPMCLTQPPFKQAGRIPSGLPFFLRRSSRTQGVPPAQKKRRLFQPPRGAGYQPCSGGKQRAPLFADRDRSRLVRCHIVRGRTGPHRVAFSDHEKALAGQYPGNQTEHTQDQKQSERYGRNQHRHFISTSGGWAAPSREPPRCERKLLCVLRHTLRYICKLYAIKSPRGYTQGFKELACHRRNSAASFPLV